MILKIFSLRRKVRPTILGSPPKWLFQKRLPRIRTSSRPRCSSSYEKSRPKIGDTPSVRKYPAETAAGLTFSGGPSPVRLPSADVYSASSSNEWLIVLTSQKFASVKDV